MIFFVVWKDEQKRKELVLFNKIEFDEIYF